MLINNNIDCLPEVKENFFHCAFLLRVFFATIETIVWAEGHTPTGLFKLIILIK